MHEELKIVPLQNFQIDLIDEGYAVWSWQGIRADESVKRRNEPGFEQLDDHLFIHRPIIRWSAESVFEAMGVLRHQTEPALSAGDAARTAQGARPSMAGNAIEARITALRFRQKITELGTAQ
jgi:hypothetical protein